MSSTLSPDLQQPKRRRLNPLRRRIVILYLIAGVLFVALVFVSVMLYREWSARFPKIAPGSYLGILRGFDEKSSDILTRFYVERREDSDEMLFLILKKGWSPELVIGVSAGSEDGAQYLPVALISDKGSLKFTGASEGERYVGRFSGRDYKGSWELQKIPPASPVNPQSTKDTQLWLLLKAELLDIDSKIFEAEAKVPEQRAEIEKLTKFITEGERLKAKANEKYNLFKAELDKSKAALKTKQEEAKKLEETLEISQKLAGMGKLVALSRDSMERESRWMESMLKPTSVQAPEDLDTAVERGERILALKRDIGQEKLRIEKLLARSENLRPSDDGGERVR